MYQISFHRAITPQTLIGNVGGYIGMCLGYSLLQIPNFVLLVTDKIKKWYAGSSYRSKTATIHRTESGRLSAAAEGSEIF